jgi:hypothetical protein
VTNEDNTTEITNSRVAANSSSSYTFNELGLYYFHSKEYPNIEGSVKVLNPDYNNEKSNRVKKWDRHPVNVGSVIDDING